MKTSIISSILLSILCIISLGTTYPWHPHDEFSRILEETVKDGKVDYVAIREKHATTLNNYIDMTGHTGIDDYPGEQQLATLIDLYNAVVLKAVADRYKPGYSVSENDFALFKAPIVPLKDKMISLNQLENEIIRPAFKDARVHVGLVCGARSCPPLLSQAFTRDNVNQLLEENMKRFVTDPQRNQIDDASKTLKLSKIFDWYADDFGGKDAVAAYVGKYSGKNLDGYKVEFLDYSWELNFAPGK